MRLFVSLGGSSVSELRFDRGPIYVGRQMGSQVFLPDKGVSRQHAVFYTTKDGTWILEDLGSSNKTYLNQVAIHKNEIKNNDMVQIADFSIRVSLEDDDVDESKMAAPMEDTVVGDQIRRELHTVERNLDAIDAPPIRFPAKRVKQLCQAMTSICTSKNFRQLYEALCEIGIYQFSAVNVWIAIRKAGTGPMDFQSGKKLSTLSIDKHDLALPTNLNESIEKQQYLLVHQMPRQITNKGIRSVIIAPMMYEKHCHGVLYLENSTEHPHYTLADLDYLILIALSAAHHLQKIDHSTSGTV